MERFTAFLPDCNKVVTVCTWLLHTAQRIQEPSTNGSADFTDRDLETLGSTLGSGVSGERQMGLCHANRQVVEAVQNTDAGTHNDAGKSHRTANTIQVPSSRDITGAMVETYKKYPVQKHLTSKNNKHNMGWCC
eukprot:m.523666 g.523666  ORF g.523666 m.523666 type:complete len:134 (-) comp21977_c1_seq28:786-1187(-)